MTRFLKFTAILLLSLSQTEAAVKCGKSVSLLGAAGSGKGTAASDLLSKDYGLGPFVSYSGGAILRAGIAAKDPLALEALPYMKAGKYSPSHIVAELAARFLRALSTETNLILDGSPRRDAEVDSIDSQLGEIGREIDIVLVFKISFETSWDRVSGRQVCPTCQRTYHQRHFPSRYGDVCEDCTYSFLIRRVDDMSPEIVQTRWDVYHEMTGPVIERLRKRGIVIELDASKPAEEIQKEVLAAIKKTSTFQWKLRRKWFRFSAWWNQGNEDFKD